MDSNEIVRFALIIIAATVFIYLIHTYNNSPSVNSPSDMETFYADGEQTDESPANKSLRQELENEYRNEDIMNAAKNFKGLGSGTDGTDNSDSDANSDNESNAGDNTDPQPSEGEGDENETYKTVAQNTENNNNQQNNSGNNVNSNRLPNECYPKDVLTPNDLLPQDANSTWAQTVPNGQGSLGDQNFLNAGFHVGINTVGQSLRNANLQLRSEPANPQLKVSPWLQTTIEPDVNRRAMEIGA